jgi:hypothetical protein
VKLDERLHQINRSLRLFHEEVGMIFLVQEVCGGRQTSILLLACALPGLNTLGSGLPSGASAG